jgi:signal transduction histidine kinase
VRKVNDKHIKVLLIEDNPGDVRLIRQMLAEVGTASFDLEWADRLSTGLERLARAGIDVLLLDLSLPDSQQLDTFARAQAQALQVPIIVLTGLEDEMLAVAAVREGAQDYLVKGKVDSNLLGRTIRYAIQRKKAEEALIRSERLKALGEMAAGVAHDFNNLLAIILGNAQLLEKGLKRYKIKEIKERLKIIARTASEGGETVRRLQHFTHRQFSTEEFTEVDLNKIVREAVASTSPCWKDEAEGKGITIKIKEELGKLPSILGIRSELIEVLTNLIFNSLEAMKEGGEITIRTEAKENEVLLHFIDTGEGIPGRIRNKIFDPFFTTKGPKASGLGLSICYGIIKRHQGKIKVESTRKKETTFTISIPLCLEAPLKKGKMKDLEKISSQKILIIDDEEGIRDVLGRALQDEGHRVVLAGTSRQGLEKFKQDNSDLALASLQDQFDLVLTDLGMPEMTGWQLAKEIKKIDPSVLVGLITGWAVATTKEKMTEEGVDFILSKPFDLTKVVREVNAALKSKKR